MQEIPGPSQYGTNYAMIKPEPRTTPSPYAGSLSPYNNPFEPAPNYTGNILSPPTQAPLDPLPSMGMWNIPSTSDMIPGQIDVQNLDSGEIVRQLSTINSQHPLPNLDISLSDIGSADQNLSDSFTKFVNIRLNEMCPDNE